MLDALLDALWSQVLTLETPREVEILVDDRPGIVGTKRQRLLEKSRGEFVCYIDDDDRVHERYVARILEALRSTPEADCVKLTGILTANGQNPTAFENSLQHATWYTGKLAGRTCYFRCPNHLNPVKRELALKTGFGAIRYGEDADYSLRLRPLLQKEADTGPDPLYFYLSRVRF